METLESAALDRFASEIALRLRALLPQCRDLPRPQLEAAVRRALDSGRGFSIDERFDSERFVQIAFELGYLANGNSVLGWARDFLEDPTLSAPDKVSRLEGEAILRGLLKR